MSETCSQEMSWNKCISDIFPQWNPRTNILDWTVKNFWAAEIADISLEKKQKSCLIKFYSVMIEEDCFDFFDFWSMYFPIERNFSFLFEFS